MAVQPLVRRSLVPALAALALAVPAVARGAGLEAPENGAYVLARGGTTAAMSGTAYSLMFNPAGLSDVVGWDIRVDARIVNNGVTFTRAPRPDNAGAPLTFHPVSNSAGLFLGPSLLVAYHPEGPVLGHFAFGLGVFGPPGIGQYKYPDPRTQDGSIDGDESTGQRYSLISNSNTILFPSLSVAWSPARWFSAGLTVQSVYADISLAQAIAGKSVSDFESSATDGIASLAVKDAFEPSFIAGLQFKPIDGLTIGGAFRPQVVINAKGSLTISPPPSSSGFVQQGDQASLKLNLAPQARLGVGYEFGRFSVAVDGVWEGWSVYKNLVLDASNIQVKTTTNGKFASVGTTVIAKNWVDTYSGRVGFSYRVIPPRDNHVALQLHVGGLHESNAVPATSQAIDQVTGNRLGGSFGATVAYNAFAFTVGSMIYAPVTLNIKQSTAVRGVADSTDPDKPPVYVGNGTYNASLWILAFGFAYTPGSLSGSAAQ
jgi:hypothetical protein